MSGTGTPEPGGLTTREAFPLVRRLCAETNVIGFDLVELLPYRDPGYTTVMNSNRLLRECLVGLAMRKKGLGAAGFDPLKKGGVVRFPLLESLHRHDLEAEFLGPPLHAHHL